MLVCAGKRCKLFFTAGLMRWSLRKRILKTNGFEGLDRMSSSCVYGRHLAKLSDQLWEVGGLEPSYFTPRGKLVFEMYLKVTGARVMLHRSARV